MKSNEQTNTITPKPKIVVLCGGSGSGQFINHLLDQGADVTCLVNTYDDGKSTGRLRLALDTLGPSDVRKNLLSLMDLNSPGYWSRYEVFAYRYPSNSEMAGEFRAEIEEIARGGALARGERRELLRMFARLPEETNKTFLRYLSAFMRELSNREKQDGFDFSFGDCAIGNCLLLGAYLEHGNSWSKAIEDLSRVLQIRGRIEVATTENRYLCAVCRDGRILESEWAVITKSDGDIEELFLSPSALQNTGIEKNTGGKNLAEVLEYMRRNVHVATKANPSAVEVIREADVIVYGAGTFYSSLLPTLMVEELAKAIAENNRAKKIFVANIIEEADTRNHTCVDLIKRVTEYVGENAITNVLINESSQHNNEGYIKADTDRLHELSLDLRFKDFEDKTLPGRHKTDELARDVLQISDFAPVALSTGTQSSELPLVSVVMLAWNRKDEVEIGLQELRKCHYPNKEIIVVDNGSNDGTAQLVYDNFPEATVVRSHRNMGMIGYNLGFATARGKYVVMLDDDSHPAPDAIETMVRIWETDKNNEIGIMAFRVINPNIGSLVTHLWEERIVPTEVGRERDITSFPACGAGARRELFDKVGYFDDDFFIYTTEDDLAIRILDNNYRIVYEPRCVSYHRESRKNRSWKRSGRAFRNAAWLNLKHLPLYLLPLMFIRNLFWLFLRSFRNKSFTFFYYAMVGYIEGYLTFWVPLKNRKSVRYKIAVYCLSDTWISRPIFRTIKKIIKDRRYIMDKRGVSP